MAQRTASSSVEAVEEGGAGCDYPLDGLAGSWDNCPHIRRRLRSDQNLLVHFCTKLRKTFNCKVEVTIANVRENAKVLRPVCKIIAIYGCPPNIDRLMAQVKDVLNENNARLVGTTVYDQAWAIRYLIALVKKNKKRNLGRRTVL
eukprot:s466_g24.t1